MGGKARTNQECGQPKWHQQYAKRRKTGSRKVIENMKVNGNQPDGGMLHLYGQKKKAAKKAVDKARNEMRAEMVDAAGEIGARWTKRLLNACMRQCKSAGRQADRVNCPHMEKERRCTRPSEVQRNASSESYYEITREDSGQEVA